MSIIRTRERSSQSQVNSFTVRHSGVLKAWPAQAPEYIGLIGGATTGVTSIAYPTGTVPGDLVIIVVETSGDEADYSISGWQHFSGSPVVDVADATGSKLNVLYRIAPDGLASTSLPAVTDHKVYTLFSFRNVSSVLITPATDTKAVASTSLTLPAITTLSPNNLVVLIASHPSDTATAQFSNLVNANLTSITERRDVGTANGNGGGFCLYTGIAANPGSIGTSTIDIASSVTNACMVLGLEPTIALPA